MRKISVLGAIFIVFVLLNFALSDPAPIACNPLTGPQKIAVILATYEGAPTDQGNSNVAYIRELFTGTVRNFSIADYYKTISGGKTWFENVTILGPYISPAPFIHDSSQGHAQESDLMKWESNLLQLASKDADFFKFDRVVFITPTAIEPEGRPVQMGAGRAAQGICNLKFGSKDLSNAWILASKNYRGIDPYDFSNNPSSLSPAELERQTRNRMMVDMANIAHELGHTFGLGHANQIHRPTVANQPFTHDEILPNSDTFLYQLNYGDPFSLMAAGNLQWLNIAHLNQLGWVEPNQIAEVRGNNTYRIYPLETADGKLKGLKIPRVTKDPSEKTNATIWVEYRRNSSVYDTDLSGLNHSFDGALVHYTNVRQPGLNQNYPFETDLLNFQPTGQVNPNQKDFTLKGSWKDLHSKIQLDVLQITPEYLDVRVSFSP